MDMTWLNGSASCAVVIESQQPFPAECGEYDYTATLNIHHCLVYSTPCRKKHVAQPFHPEHITRTKRYNIINIIIRRK